MYDIEQARRFITALTGSASSNITFQVFYDPKKPYPKRPELAKHWMATLDQSIEYIEYAQSNFCGIHVSINNLDGRGRKDENVVSFNALVVDFDGSYEPEWMLTPHLVQKRDDTHGHAFWLLDTGECDNETWSIAQKRLSICYGSDDSLISPEHTIRLTGTGHFKDPQNPAYYSITTDNVLTIPRYSIGEVISKHALNESEQLKFDQWITAREGVVDGVGYERNEFEERKFIEFISHAAHPAVEGQGSYEVIRVASYGHDHGIPLELAQELMWEHYNPRCEPPWEDYERDQFYGYCYRAYTSAASAAGCKSYRSEFMRMELPEPECGWENQYEKYGPKEVVEEKVITTNEDMKRIKTDEYRLNREQAEILVSSFNGNTSHYDFARAYDGCTYNGCELVRFDKQFYCFTGRSWCQVHDDLIKSEIQKMLAPHKPANKLTSGVFLVLCDLVTIEPYENGQWIGDKHKDTSNLVSFRNGIVDLGADNPELIPHTHEFFTFNELPYDYQPGAQCPRWHQFLSSIWGDNKDLKLQLQQWMGYCLTRDVSLQKYAILMGKPRAGKGVVTSIIAKMIGEENISSPSLSNIVKDSMLDKMSTSAVALIPDAHNVNLNIRDSVLSNLKAITGNDDIGFHRMYKGGVSMVFTCKLMMSTNNVPDFNDPSGALADRMLVFPFPLSFAGNPNPNLKKELSEEIPGILQWSIDGLKSLRGVKGHFTEAKEGLTEKKEIKEDMFPLAAFVNEVCVLDRSEFTFIDDIYNSYRIWAMANGIKSPMNQISLKKCLRNSPLPISLDRLENGTGFNGITVNSVMTKNVVPFPAI